MGEELNKAYYAVIPANVRYDKGLPPNAKLLYGEITALCNQTGYCWASNEYFASLYKCEIRTVQRWLSKLTKRGYISVKLIHKEGGKEVEKRYISLNTTPEDKNVTGYGQKCQEGNDKNVTTPHDKKVIDNNTFSFNNTSNKKKESKKEPERASYDTILSNIKNESLRDLYYEFIKMRALMKAPLTNRALKMLITKVNELEPNNPYRQKLMLENSILNNWKSVYPIKDEDSEEDSVTDIVFSREKNTKLDELRKIYS